MGIPLAHFALFLADMVYSHKTASRSYYRYLNIELSESFAVDFVILYLAVLLWKIPRDRRDMMRKIYKQILELQYQEFVNDTSRYSGSRLLMLTVFRPKLSYRT